MVTDPPPPYRRYNQAGEYKGQLKCTEKYPPWRAHPSTNTPSKHVIEETVLP